MVNSWMYLRLNQPDRAAGRQAGSTAATPGPPAGLGFGLPPKKLRMSTVPWAADLGCSTKRTG